MSEPEDVPLPLEKIRQRHIRRWFIIVVVIQSVFLIILSLILWSRPIGPSVSAKSLLLGTVKKGIFLIQIQAEGMLKPRIERWVSSNVGGVVQILSVHPGTMIHKGSPLLTLSNPNLLTQLQKAKYALTQTMAQGTAQKANLEDQLYSLESQRVSDKAKASSAEMLLKADRSLLREAVISRLQYETDKLNVQNDKELVTSLEQRIAAFRRNVTAQIQGEQSLISSGRAALEAAKANVVDLQPRASMDGEVRTVSVQVGQSIGAGADIVRISDARKLDAVLSMPETNAAEIEPGQPVKVILPILHEPTIPGAVLRISPNVVHDTVPVTVRLHGKLVSGARPQMVVTGIIRVGKLVHTLYVAKPMGAQEDSDGVVYVLSANGHTAVKRSVRFGLASSTGIQILSGLKPGQRVVLSNTSKWGRIMQITQ